MKRNCPALKILIHPQVQIRLLSLRHFSLPLSFLFAEVVVHFSILQSLTFNGIASKTSTLNSCAANENNSLVCKLVS